MTIFKCKMCGGTLSVQDGVSIAECEYCGTKQTLPTSNDEVIVNLFNRANNLRLKSEYDKAAEIYEKILEIDDSLAEAHWGLVLCKYGVEYVEDPLTKERIPTCHRTQLVSILTDVEYHAALKHADAASRELYEQQAHEINELQKKILEIVKSEKPFDVFICYKETDESGARTKDSVIANEIYHELTNSGLKVFFSAITLEDKLGQEYEPYIFAALTSAKVMLVLGTKPEYFNAVWVKNEWSRYLHLMKTDRQTKRTLIPCFRDMDAYDLPDEFSHLQALDMANIAFMPDLTRNIRKLIGTPAPAAQQSVPVSEPQTLSVQVESLLKRAFMMLEDEEFEQADTILEKALDKDPENAKAYVGKFLVSRRLKQERDICTLSHPITDDKYFQKALRFADEKYKQVLLSYNQEIICRISEGPYQQAVLLMNKGLYVEAEEEFRKIKDYKDSAKLADKCKELALQKVYDSALEKKNRKEYQEAAGLFASIVPYKDADAQKQECLDLKDAVWWEERQLEEKRRKKKTKTICIAAVVAVILIIAGIFSGIYIYDHRLGGENNPIVLSTPEDLMSINSFGEYGEERALTYYVLENDIDLSGYNWVSLGSRYYSHPYFYGVIDGQGYTIRDLTGSAFIKCVGPNSVITDLNFENVYISGSGSDLDVADGIYTLGVITDHNGGTISDCSVSGMLLNAVSDISAVGGIAGESSGIIQSCHVSGKITHDKDMVISSVGGIAGRSSVIQDCSFTGTIIGEHMVTVGGIAGRNNNLIQGCTVSGTFQGYWSVGGICGEAAEISNCIFKGDVKVGDWNTQLGGRSRVGGIGGSGDSIISCTSSGTVTGNMDALHFGFAGAIIGEGGMMENCVSSSTVYVRDKFYSTWNGDKWSSPVSQSYGLSGDTETVNNGGNKFTGKIVKK